MVESVPQKQLMKSVIYTAPGEFEYSPSTMTVPVPAKG
jgi:hypothetical protein